MTSRRLVLLIPLLAGCTLTGLVKERKAAKADGFYSDGIVASLAEGRTAGAVLGLPAPTDRFLVRTGKLQLRTGNPQDVGARAQGLVHDAGGWLVRRRNLQFVFRVPAAKFDEIFGRFEQMGAVVYRETDATDVTELVRDLELRLRNARALRDRYAALLEKAEAVKDVLEIEKELGRITVEVERLEGQLQRKRQEIAYSLLQLDLVAAAASRPAAAKSPFPWLARIGLDQMPAYRRQRARSSRVRWTLPEDFADMGRVSGTEIRGWAYSPDGIRIVVRRFENKPRQRRAFWLKELQREFVRVRGYETLEGASTRNVLMFGTISDGHEMRYGIRLITTNRYLTTVEVAGPRDLVESHGEKIASILKTVEEGAR